MTNLVKSGVSRRAVLGYGAAGAAALAMPSIVRAQDKSLKVGAYGGYFKDSFDKHIFPVFTKETGIAVEFGRRADRRGLARAAPAGGAGERRAGRRLDDVADLDAEGHGGRSLGAARSRPRCRTPPNVKPEFVNKYPDGRVSGVGAVTWYITLVSNTKAYPTAPDSWGFLWDPSNADKLGPAGARLQLVPAGDHLEDLLRRRHQEARHRRRHPGGAGQDRRAEAEREALVPRRGAVRAGAEIGRDPDGPVLSRRDRPRGRRRLSGALDLPEGRRRQRRRLVGGLQGLDEDRRGARLHRLHARRRRSRRCCRARSAPRRRSRATCST